MPKSSQDAYRMRKPHAQLRQIRLLLACFEKKQAPAWLLREHYLLCGMCRSVIAALSHMPRIPYVKDAQKRMIPYAFVLSQTVPPRADTEEMIASLGHFRVDEVFLRYFPTMRAAAALCAISAQRAELAVPQNLGAWLDQLRSTKEIDWSAVHDSLSEVEKVLMSDPCGAYPLCDDESKAAYRSAVSRLAKRQKISEESAANAVLQSAKATSGENGGDIADQLFFPFVDRRGIILHIVRYAVTAVLSLCAAFSLGDGWVQRLAIGCALYLPLYALVRECVGAIAWRCFGKHALPVLRYRIERGQIPNTARVLTVTTALLRDAAGGNALVRNLERFYLRNRDENAYFGLLCDLPSADAEIKDGDGALIEAVKAQIAALNRKWGEHFCLFVRRRQYSAGEDCYMGWERKRGAVLMLSRLLRGVGAESFVCTFLPSACKGSIRYVCTLDEDTELPPDALHVMVGAMLHPHNRPIIKDGCVRRGCGILQPDMAVTLHGAAASRFTLLCTGKGGADPYSRDRIDTDAILYGTGSFCGKGMFDVDAFLAVLDGAFPDHAVLSHDFLEGARLGCRNFPAVTLSDSIPTTPYAYFARQSRWVRGDVQALRFAFTSHRNAGGDTVKNPISVTDRMRVIDHVLHALTPPAMLRAALIFAFLPLSDRYVFLLWVLLLSPYLLRPLALCLRPWAWRCLRRQFFCAVYTDLRQALYWLGFRIAYLAQEGWVNTKAIVTSLYRMFLSKQHLLEWVTAGEREKRQETTRAAMFRSARASVILGAVLLLFSPHLSSKLIGCIWLMVPWISSAVSDPPKIRYTRRFSVDFAKKKPDGVLTTDEYRMHARQIWQFFSDTVNETTNHLPPDNIQWFPLTEKKTAMRTSPTNIGLYFCACVSACQFGLIGVSELYDRLSAAYRRICRMKRYCGHLYNWYELHRCEVIGVPYISTVDSGNFVCAMLCTAAAATAYAQTDSRFLQLADNLRQMAYETDFSFLYHKQSGQLHIGYDTEQAQLSEGRYDLYASEARSAVYFAAARGQIPSLAWNRLSSPITVQGSMVGTLSWSGSAFEYFMPSLWLPTPENGHAAQMLAFAFEAQADDAVCIRTDYGMTAVFGKSEGAYFGFDAARNFSYQPYGTPSLALADDRGEQLCMPYALYLMLPFAPGVVRGAFDALEMLGMRGMYGYYEALDAAQMRVGGGYAVVRSYMAHHMAMSLIALANAAFDGLFQRYFMADAHMEAFAILLDQRIAADAVPTKRIDAEDRAQNTVRNNTDLPIITSHTHAEEIEPVCTVLSNSLSYLLADTAGNMTFYHGKLALTPADWSESSLVPTVNCKDMANGRVYSPNARSAQHAEDADFHFREEAGALIWYGAYDDGTDCQLTAHISSRGVGLQLEISLSRHGQPIPFTLTFSYRPVLYEPYAYAVHRTFADLFLQIRRVEGENRITVQRRPRSENEKALCLTVFAGGLEQMQTASDASHLLPLGYTRQDRRMLADAVISATTAVSAVTPFLLLRGYVPIGTTALTLSLGEEPPQFDTTLIARIRREAVLLCGGAATMKYVGEMLTAIAHRHGTKLISTKGRIRPIRSPRGKERLWKYGISGDLPYFCVMADGHDADFLLAAEVLSSWKYLLLCGVHCDLVLCVHETDAYGNPTERRFTEEIRRQGLSYFFKSSDAAGAIHICSQRDAEADGLLLSAGHVFAKETSKRCVYPVPPQIVSTDLPSQITHYTLDARRVVVTKGKQPMPWSFVLSNGVFSTLLTTNTLGFTFFENARECRVTPWYGDAASERCGEFLFLRFAGSDAYYDLCRASRSVVIHEQSVHYLGMIGDLSYRISVSIPSRMRHKRMELRIKNEGTENLSVRLRYQVEPLFGVVREDGEVLSWFSHGGELCFVSETNAACAPYTAKLSLVGCADGTMGQAGEEMVYVGGSLSIPAGEEVLASAHLRIDRAGQRPVSNEALVPVRSWRRPQIRSGDEGLDALAAVWLPWQIVGVRMFARCGFYQPGGAYGFRDQLQDAMAAGIFAPQLLYAQLFRAAAHQYREGDVQHWWHPGPIADRAKFHRGIRSRCSDDRLWMVLAAAHYVRLTGDTDCLSKEVRYLESPPLDENETERYEVPLRSSVRESLYMHCVRAIEYTLDVGFGIHGLPYIGIGDWNDGMNRVGIHGQGESVWCGMFFMLVLSEFLPLCAEMGDEDGIRSYSAVIKHLATAIESEAWNGQWYRRAWYDDGTPIGDPEDREARIDLLPQAFAALVNARVRLPGGGKPFDEERVHAAMTAAYTQLFDEEHGVFALLDPPFGSAEDTSLHNPGYIAGYPSGARENGGQYTHAAVWGAMGLFAVGETERGMRVVKALSPLMHTQSDADLMRYQKEPWALCGDVLRCRGREGEGGWSLYTGSAAWYYRLLLMLFGGEDGMR